MSEGQIVSTYETRTEVIHEKTVGCLSTQVAKIGPVSISIKVLLLLAGIIFFIIGIIADCIQSPIIYF
jgi:hypothetical protein